MENKDVVIDIILAEYSELRAELMYFISEQRKSISLMSTIVGGQAAFLISNNKVNYEFISYMYLYVIPFAVFILMLRSIEATSRILVLADYIHKGIKVQLVKLVEDEFEPKQYSDNYKNTGFFEWEEHKGETNRIPKKTMEWLDHSKWYIFVTGIFVSYGLGLLFLHKTDSLELSVIAIPTIINILWVFFAWKVTAQFNESKGECLNAPRESD
jgi:hypothetical protein